MSFQKMYMTLKRVLVCFSTKKDHLLLEAVIKYILIVSRSANQKKKKGDKNNHGEMEELPDYPKDRNTKAYSREIELDPSR